VSYSTEAASPGSVARLQVGERTLDSFRGGSMSTQELREQRGAWEKQAAMIVAEAGYPLSAAREQINVPMVLLILVVIMSFSAMVYGPMAALLTELFPAKVRYTSMSLPYHLGTGWFGGFLPPVAFAIVAATGNIYSGLWYPLIGAALTLVVGLLLLPETKGNDLRQ
jgi:MFS family permease